MRHLEPRKTHMPSFSFETPVLVGRWVWPTDSMSKFGSSMSWLVFSSVSVTGRLLVGCFGGRRISATDQRRLLLARLELMGIVVAVAVIGVMVLGVG